jgi:hypothetical protein
MKKQDRKPRKLRVAREKIKPLQNDSLANVAGGLRDDDDGLPSGPSHGCPTTK